MSTSIRYEEWPGIVKGVVRELLGPEGLGSRDSVRETMDSCLVSIALTCADCGHVFTPEEKKKLMLFGAAGHAGLPLAEGPACPECDGNHGLVEQ